MDQVNTSPKYKALVFSWNTESVGLCETGDVDIANYNRTSYSSYISGLTTWKYSCNIPDFYPKFSQFVVDNSPDLVIIGFQEDRYPGSYFHSHLLLTEMPKIGYELVKRSKLMGVGVTSYKGALEGDLFERGIRVSIYAKTPLALLIEKEEIEMRAVIGNNGQSEYVCSPFIIRGKGAVVSYIILPVIGRIAFICCHLPFNAKSLIDERLYNNKMLRQNEINYSNICFNNIIENLVLSRNPMPAHVVYFGDFNYRLADPRPASVVAKDLLENNSNQDFLHKIYLSYDELHEQMTKGNIYKFTEGIDNNGPNFIPTCKMIKGRNTDLPDNNDPSRYWNTGSEDQRVPSWCDRILYRNFGNNGHYMVCTYYDRFDIGVMSKSDHAGVLSIFDIY